jgi:prevent-host-death family protein
MAMPTVVVNTHEAKSRLSELLRHAEAGDEVIVARNGQPVARIVPWRPEVPVRTAGAWRGRVHYDDDIVGSDADVVAMFEHDHSGDR